MARSASLTRSHQDKIAETPRREAPGVLRELTDAAGVTFNGSQPWDIQVKDDRLYDRVIREGSLGFGEAYMDGWWECERLDELFHQLLSVEADEGLGRVARLRFVIAYLRNVLMNRQSKSRAGEVGEQHYDAGNHIFEAMLDPTMSYSCGYWADADNLADAQLAKLRLSCEKLQLEPGQRLLDIGCGWGGLAKFAAENYGVEVTGITISGEQKALAEERCRGLPVTIELMDYRDLEGTFDRVVSIGMFEHVGPKNYDAYFATVHRLLADEGLFLLHTIANHRTAEANDDWMDKYIFPNGKLPSAQTLTAAMEPYFLIEDWHAFGQDYDRTLMAWWDNFDRAWPDLEHPQGERFYRMWKYYLQLCAGFFRSRQGQLWQVMMGKRSRRDVYRSIR
ncbi:MAG: cyclopropane fatty acyl phospholipid synthase [Gammaproteobacteria bacterium]|nr:cyclopropane fatty acyl phospholipid synthase [Gammaproteobacteria bacterium]